MLTLVLKIDKKGKFMRIKSLWISEYKNLKDFTIEFDTSSPLNIIIGANGSGKSNFLEALALIFKDLYLIKESIYYDDKLLENRSFSNSLHLFSSINFSYSLEMIDKEKDIIKIQYESNEAYVFYKNQVEFSLYDGLIFLPENILVNYSGNSNRIKNIVNRFLLEKNKLEKELSDLVDFDEYYEDAKDYDFNGLSLYSERIIELIILSNFYLEKNYESELFKTIGIKEFNNFELSFNIPKELPKGYGTYRYEGKERFNYEEIKYHFLDGDSRKILEILAKFGDVKTSSYSGYISKIGFNPVQLYQLFEELENEYFIRHEDFFEYLFSLFKSIKVRDIKLHFMINKGDEPIMVETNDLSEGERQFILNTGISDLFSNSKSIFLLDEPDTYLHPNWQRLLTDFLNRNHIKGQILMTTHSPITLGKVKRESIKIFKDGKVYVPSSDSMNRDVAEILGEIMDVSPRPSDAVNIIKEFEKAIAFKQIDKAKIIYERLNHVLSKDDPFILKANSTIKRMEILNEKNNKN